MRWLPTEILDQIFRDVLCVGKIDPWAHSYLGPLTPGLLSPNRATSAEALRIFYGENCFDLRIFKSNHTATFIHDIGSNAKKIKVVHIDVNLCPDDSGPDQDTTDLLDLLRRSCENLIKVIVSMPEKCGLDTAAAVVSKIPRHGDIEISIYSKGHNGTETLPVEIKFAKQRVMGQYSNRIHDLDCLECNGSRSSPGTAPDRHPHLLQTLTEGGHFDASFHREIHLMILRDAKDMKETRYPVCDRTIISANGKLRHVELEDFPSQSSFCNDPKPTNALQETFNLFLLLMKYYTVWKNTKLGYGKFRPKSREVISRRDIRSTFLSARTLDFEGMCQQISSIRILDFLEERAEYKEYKEYKKRNRKRTQPGMQARNTKEGRNGDGSW